MRIDSVVTVILVLLGLAVPAISSQNSAALGSHKSRPSITSLSVAEDPYRVDVEVEFTDLVQPEVSRLEHPDRLVFDFPGCDLAGPGERFVVNSGSVVAVTTAAVGATPGARVVIELRSARGHERATPGNKLVVGLSSTGNYLIIDLSENKEARSSAKTTSAPASQGNRASANSQPAPKGRESDRWRAAHPQRQSER
jgi:hypothetical protein